MHTHQNRHLQDKDEDEKFLFALLIIVAWFFRSYCKDSWLDKTFKRLKIHMGVWGEEVKSLR